MAPKSPSRFLLLLAAALAACDRRAADAGDATADTVTAAGAAEAGPVTEDPPLELLSPAIRRACASVAAYWHNQPGVAMRQFDSTVTLPRGGPVTDACWVMVRLEEDRDREPEFRVPFVAAGWLPVYEFDADGPDGRSRVYQLDPVRCWAEERWDGGDDADSTYVPAEWFEQHVACYRR